MCCRACAAVFHRVLLSHTRTPALSPHSVDGALVGTCNTCGEALTKLRSDFKINPYMYVCFPRCFQRTLLVRAHAVRTLLIANRCSALGVK